MEVTSSPLNHLVNVCSANGQRCTASNDEEDDYDDDDQADEDDDDNT